MKNKLLWFVLACVVSIILYFFLRLSHITSLPLFTDEAIYIRWAQIAKQDANWRFISLTDGKQPMYVWVAVLFLKFVKEPLLAGRLVSVFAGFATTIGLFFLGNEIFREKLKNIEYKIFSFTQKSVSIGLVSSFLYVIYPFGLVYDRMALYDSMVGAFAVWSLYLLLLLVRSLRLDIALISGIVIGGGLLTKTNAFFSLGSMPFLLFVFDWKKKIMKNSLLKFAALALVVIILSNIIYSILRLSPFYHIIADKNALFVYPLNEWLGHPFTYFSSNISALINWFWVYFTVPFIILAALSFTSKKFLMEKIMILMWFLFPFTYLAFFGNTIYPRFILFMTLPLLILVAYSIAQLFEKYKSLAIRVVFVAVIIIIPVVTDYFILYNFQVAPIPRADLIQYSNSWSAGNGVKESVEFFSEKAQNHKIYIATEGTFGLMPFGLEMYLVDNPNVKIKAYWPIHETEPEEVIRAAKTMPTYAIFYQPCPSCNGAGNIPTGWHAKLISKYKQGTSDMYYGIYQILP